eukprot:s3317_g6.t1
MLLIFLLAKLLSLLKPSAPMHGAARHAHMVRAAAREAAAEMQKEFKLTFDDYACHLPEVQPNLIAADFPSRARQHWLAARLNRDHAGRYLVVNLSGATYDNFELQGPVLDVMMSGCVPPLEVLLRLVVSMHRWLTRTPLNVVVAHGPNESAVPTATGPGPCPVVLLYACYLSWLGLADHPREAMQEVMRLLGLPDVLWPSQRRYLSYFGLLQGGLDLQAQGEGRLARVVLLHAGSEDRERLLEVWKQDQLVFRAHIREDDDVCHTSALRVTPNDGCFGDLSMRMVTRQRPTEKGGAVDDWQLEFQVCFHTAFLAAAGGVKRFDAAELDLARGVRPEGCAVDVFLEPMSSEPQDDSENSATAAAAAASRGPRKADGAVEFFDLAAADAEADAEVSGMPDSYHHQVFAPDDIDAFFDEL